MPPDIQKSIQSRRRDKLLKPLMKRKNSWRKAFNLQTYHIYLPLLWVLLLTVVMPAVGHCNSPGKLLNDENIGLVPPQSNELVNQKLTKRMLSADPTGSCSLYRLDNTFVDSTDTSEDGQVDLWLRYYENADKVDCLPNDETNIESECDDNHVDHPGLDLLCSSLSGSVRVSWIENTVDQLVHQLSARIFITSATQGRVGEVTYTFKYQYQAASGFRYWVESTAGCAITSFTAPTSPTTPYVYDIGASAITFSIDPWTWTETPNTCAYTETLTFSPDLSGFSWISVAGRTVTISTSDVSFCGISQSFTVTSTLNDSIATNDNGYSVQIDLQSDITSFAAPASPSPYTFDIGDTDHMWTIESWAQTPACGFTETLSFTPDLTSIAWISVSGRVVTISTSDTALHGTSQTFTVISTLDDATTTSDNGYSFTINLNNPCTTTALVAPTSPASYTFDIGGTDYSWAIAAWTQETGCTHSETLSFSPDLANYAWIQVTGRIVTISTGNTALHGTSETFTVTSQVNDSTATSDNGYSFTINFNNPCLTTTLIAPSSPDPYTFNIGETDYSWTIAAWTQEPGCTHTETISFNPDPASYDWISVNGRTITISASDTSQHGTTQTFTVTTTINDSATTSDSGYAFEITLINPCTSTTLIAPPSPAPYTFDICSTDYSWAIAAWTQEPGCRYTENLTFFPSLSSYPWITLFGRTMTISTSDTSLDGTSQLFIVSSTVNDSTITVDSGYAFEIILSNDQNLCSADRTHTYTCDINLDCYAPIALNPVKENYIQLYHESSEITLEFINPLLQSYDTPAQYLANLEGLEITVTQNDHPAQVVSSQPTYSKNGKGTLTFTLDGNSAFEIAQQTDQEKIEANIEVQVQDLNTSGKYNTFNFKVIFEDEQEAEQTTNNSDQEESNDVYTNQATSSAQSEESQPNDLANNEAFQEIPLELRLADEGVGKLYELLLRQRALLQEQAIQFGDFQGRPVHPDVQIASFSKVGVLVLEFNNQMNFPADLANIINENAAKNLDKRKLTQHDGIQIELFLINGDSEQIDQNLIAWSVTQVSSTEIVIHLDFEKPILVSQGDNPDILYIQVSLNAYTDYSGKTLPPSLIKRREIPIQFGSLDEAITFTNIADSVSEATTIIASSNAVTSIVMQTSLYQLWSLINSQQIVLQLPLMEGIKFPANTMVINQVFIEITSFEIIDSEKINDEIFHFPEVEPFSLNFQECQIEYVFFLLILGLPLYIMLAHFVLMILYFTFALINRCVQSKYLDKLVRKLKFYLFWNGFIRLYMELYQGLCIATVLNLYTAENALESPFLWVRICYYCSIFSLVLIITVPFFIFVPLYFKRRDKWSTDAFQKVYGALLEGTRVDLIEKEVQSRIRRVKMMLSNRLLQKAILKNSSLPMRRLKLHEYQADALLNYYQVPIPIGDVAFSVTLAENISKGIIGGCVVKSLIREKEVKGNWVMLLVPTMFFFRRLAFISSIIILRENILALILIQIAMIKFNLIILHTLRTFETRTVLYKQTLDECTYLLLIYILMCFTDFVPDPEQRSQLGIVYISIMFSNIGMHMLILLRSTLSGLVRLCKRCYNRRHLYWCKCCCCCKKKLRPKFYVRSFEIERELDLLSY